MLYVFFPYNPETNEPIEDMECQFAEGKTPIAATNNLHSLISSIYHQAVMGPTHLVIYVNDVAWACSSNPLKDVTKCELFYSDGGHSGRYVGVMTAINMGKRLLLGSRTERRIEVRKEGMWAWDKAPVLATLTKTHSGDEWVNGLYTI